MNVSKLEQRVLHALAQGGAIHFERNPNGKVRDVTCYTREGYVLVDCSLGIFERLKKRRFIRSRSGNPYQVTRLGVQSVRAQLDNR